MGNSISSRLEDLSKVVLKVYKHANVLKYIFTVFSAT